jgi:hypothetical protein
VLNIFVNIFASQKLTADPTATADNSYNPDDLAQEGDTSTKKKWYQLPKEMKRIVILLCRYAFPTRTYQ